MNIDLSLPEARGLLTAARLGHNHLGDTTTYLHAQAGIGKLSETIKALEPAPEPDGPSEPHHCRIVEHYAAEAVEAYLGSYNEFDPENDAHQGCLADEVESQVPVMRSDLFQLVVDDNAVGGLPSVSEAADAATYLRDAIVEAVGNRAGRLVRERTA